MHNSATIISKTGVRYQVNGQMVVDEAVDHLWEPEKIKQKNKDGDTTMMHWKNKSFVLARQQLQLTQVNS